MKIKKLLAEKLMNIDNDIRFAKHSVFSASTLMHTHDFHEIFVINKGNVIHQANGLQKTVTENSIVFIRPSDIHCYRKANRELELVNIALTESLLASCLAFAENLIDIDHYYTAKFPLSFTLTTPVKQAVIKELTLAAENIISNPAASKLKFKIAITALFVRFFSSKMTGNDTVNVDVPQWLIDLKEMMRKKENFIIGLPKMQATACCSVEHLCRCWQRYFNETPTEFINRLRITYASFMLCETDEKIATVALESGFVSLSHFYHQFKKYFTISPRAYRKLKKHSLIP
ncbi:MAG: AraC family transcriptional regulator [Victivallaceae bacterium]|nr:AraC family transcriptional regulator [Victivallaceae bacterium]